MIASLPLRQKLAGFAFVAALALAGCGDDADSASFETPDPSEPQLVYSVDAAEVAVMESMPLQIRITAQGMTRTGGWTDAALVLDEEASSGVTLVYRFVAVRPTGMATQAFTPIEASVDYGPWVDRAGRVIEIVAETNTYQFAYPSSEE